MMSDDDPAFEGMTVNERLYAAGLLDKFYVAFDGGDGGEVRRLLERVGVDELSISRTLERMGRAD